MSEAQQDVAMAYQEARAELSLRGGPPDIDDVLRFIVSQALTLILERLDNIEREIRFANNKGMR